MPFVNNLFLGVTTAPARAFVGAVAAAGRFATHFFPCAGRFAAVAAAVQSGVRPDSIHASDISLFSSVIGCLADPRRSVEELEVRAEGKAAGFLTNAADAIDWSAGVLLLVKYSALTPRSEHDLNLRRELWSARTAYRDHLAGQLRDLLSIIRGLRYEVADLRDAITAAASADRSFLYVNPPGYRNGYAKMFAGLDGVLNWRQPDIPEFDPRATGATLVALTGTPCRALAYVHHGLDQMPEGWTPVFAVKGAGERNDFIVSNSPLEHCGAFDPIRTKPAKLLPIFDDGPITPGSLIQFVPTDRDTCLYYRDLFVHRLGATEASRYLLMLIDGRVTTAVGLNDQNLLVKQTGYLNETFGISVSSSRYARLGKLFMFCLTSGDMQRYLLSTSRAYHLRPPAGIETTSITVHEEGKTDRGVMRLVTRERRPDGRFRLVYRADFRDDTWADCLTAWLKRWGTKERMRDARTTA